ncbi:MAG: hypothetical protein QM784_04620 [Polyangiaceae bacterium]
MIDGASRVRRRTALAILVVLLAAGIGHQVLTKRGATSTDEGQLRLDVATAPSGHRMKAMRCTTRAPLLATNARLTVDARDVHVQRPIANADTAVLLVKPGDRVSVGSPLLQLKAATNSPATNSPARGRLVRAERAGTVIELHPSVTIARANASLLAQGDFHVRDLSSVTIGSKAPVKLTGTGDILMCSVVWIGNVVHRPTQTVSVNVTLVDAPKGLSRSTPIELSVERLDEARSCVVVPARAVSHSGSTTSVFVAREGAPPERTEVHLGVIDDDNAEVLEGLEGGETLIEPT